MCFPSRIILFVVSNIYTLIIFTIVFTVSTSISISVYLSTVTSSSCCCCCCCCTRLMGFPILFFVCCVLSVMRSMFVCVCVCVVFIPSLQKKIGTLFFLFLTDASNKTFEAYFDGTNACKAAHNNELSSASHLNLSKIQSFESSNPLFMLYCIHRLCMGVLAFLFVRIFHIAPPPPYFG